MGNGKRISAEVATCKIAVRNEALLSIADARVVLTRVEDSLETVLDVLREMKVHVAEGTTSRKSSMIELMDAAVRLLQVWLRPFGDDRLFGDNQPCGGNRPFGDSWPLGDNRPSGNSRPSGDNGPSGASVASENAHRLVSLSQEIDQILRDTTFAGTPVFADSPSRPIFVVSAPQDDPIEIAFDPLSAAGLSVAFGDRPSTRNQNAGSRPECVDRAIIQVRQRIDEIIRFRDRLGLLQGAIELPRGVHGSRIRTPADAFSVREILAVTTRRIMDDAELAARAQANELSHAAKRLALSMYGSDDDEAPARVYVLDQDGENAPVTHLRRSMIRGRS